MAQAILTVLLVVILLAYGALFALWNQQVVTVVGASLSLQPGGPGFWASVPLFVLPMAGLVVGALLMAIIMGGPWSGMKRTVRATRERLAAEQARARELARRLKACQAQLKAAPGAMATATVAAAEEDEEAVAVSEAT